MQYATMERADEPVEQGTPINKELFDSIKSGNDLVQKFNTAEIEKMWDDYNHLKLDNSIAKYEKGMRVFIDIPIIYETIENDLIPTFTSNNDNINGFKINGAGSFTNAFYAFDNNQNTYAEKPSGINPVVTLSIISTNAEYFPLKAKFKYLSPWIGVNFGIGLYKNGWTSDYKTYTVDSGQNNVWFEKEFDLSGNTPLNDSTSFSVTIIKQSVLSRDYEIVWRVNDMQITKYKVGRLNSYLYSYININGLGEKLINQKLEMGKKYELIYDGTTFNATEVV